MTAPRLIITQLPTSLWNSPIFEAYDYYVDDGLDTLQGDLEGMFHLTNTSCVNKYLIGLKFELYNPNIRKIDLDGYNGYERLKFACAYTTEPIESLFWLLRISQRIDIWKDIFKTTGLQLKTNTNNTGAILGPLSASTSSWPRVFT